MNTTNFKSTFFLFLALLIGVSCSDNKIDASFTIEELEARLSEISSIQDDQQREVEADSLWSRLTREDQIPFRDGTTALFLYRGDADSVSWNGDFNSWGEDKSFQNNGTAIQGTNIWVFKTTFPSDARLDYKIAVNESWIIDPVNPHYQWSGFGPNSELRMPKWKPEPLKQRIPEARKGNITDNIRFKSSSLGYNVQYKVYTPVGYENLTGLPVIYILDGQEYLDDRLGGAAIMLDNLIHLNEINPIVAVFVDPRVPSDEDINRRTDEFSVNSEYNDFFVNELIPEINNDYKVSTERSNTALLGTSLGGLNTAYLGFTNPEIFGRLGIQAPAFWYKEKEIFGLVRDTEKVDFNIYMSTGTIGDNLNDARRMKQEFDRLNLSYTYEEVNEGHSWGAWSAQLDDILIQFFKK
ncbi:MAG: alpha/beta hydrolase-fold protein [Balneola sp.]